MMGIWDFIQNQILGMRWLHDLVGAALSGLSLDINTKIGGSIHFFIYDIIKIMVLLGTLIFIISYIQSYFPPERTKKILGRFHGLSANILAALLGTVFVLFHTSVHRVYNCRPAFRYYILISDFFTDG